MRPPIDNGVVLVTGASSGIGLELARLLAGRARVLILVARRRDRLEALREELLRGQPQLKVVVAVCDLGDLGEIDGMLAAVAEQAGPVDVLINNAGFADLGVYDLTGWSKTRQMIAVNVTALAYLTHRLAGPMVERGLGGVLNISSGWGMTFGPGMSAYIGTKHFVTGFTESLRLDLSGTGVVVTQSCPPPVATEFNDVIGNFTGMTVPGAFEISARTCARASLRAFDRGRAMVVPGVMIWLLLLLANITPRFVLRMLWVMPARMLRRKQRRVLAERSTKGGDRANMS